MFWTNIKDKSWNDWFRNVSIQDPWQRRTLSFYSGIIIIVIWLCYSVHTCHKAPHNLLWVNHCPSMSDNSFWALLTCMFKWEVNSWGCEYDDIMTWKHCITCWLFLPQMVSNVKLCLFSLNKVLKSSFQWSNMPWHSPDIIVMNIQIHVSMYSAAHTFQ